MERNDIKIITAKQITRIRECLAILTVEHESLQTKCDRYEAALKIIGGGPQTRTDAMNVANEALSAEEGKKEDPNPVNWNDYLRNQKEDQQ